MGENIPADDVNDGKFNFFFSLWNGLVKVTIRISAILVTNILCVCVC